MLLSTHMTMFSTLVLFLVLVSVTKQVAPELSKTSFDPTACTRSRTIVTSTFCDDVVSQKIITRCHSGRAQHAAPKKGKVGGRKKGGAGSPS
jgi:hypothetical protein